MSVALRLLGRPGCHLCERMAEELIALGDPRLSFTVVDVDSDPALARRYGTRIPVLLAGEELLCELRVDPGRLRAWLDADG